MTAHAPAKILVVGLGNPDCGDDGVGALVVERLEGRLPAGVALAARRGDMLALIEDWAGFNAVLCVDAAAPRGRPGRVERLEPGRGDLMPPTPATSTHALGLAAAVELAAALGIAPRELIVYAIEGNCFESGAGMTAAVVAAAQAVVEAVIDEVARARAKGSLHARSRETLESGTHCAAGISATRSQRKRAVE